MALFDSSANDAVAAAPAMLRALDQLNDERAQKGLDQLAIGIGIHTGRLMLGTIGGDTRLDCTVIGDPANLAARVEGMTSKYGSYLLISGDTREALSDPRALTMRRLDRVQAKGKGAVIDIFEVLDAEPAARRDQKQRVLAAYEAALDHYLKARFEEAAAAFRECAEMAPLDAASKMMWERATSLSKQTPGGWPGHTRLSSK